MTITSFFKKGDWNFICDICGKKMKASDARLRWDGFRVCPGDWEPRQPQDFVRGKPDHQTPPWTRPEAGDQFVPGSFCSAVGRSGVAGKGVAGCMIAARPAPQE